MEQWNNGAMEQREQKNNRTIEQGNKATRKQCNCNNVTM